MFSVASVLMFYPGRFFDYAGIFFTPAHQARVVAGILQLRRMSILLIEVFLVTGLGLVDANLQLLDAIRHLVTFIGLPVVVMCDCQVSCTALTECPVIQG